MIRRALLCLTIVVSVATGVPTAAAAPTPFTGAWQAIDVDGSQMFLTVSGGHSPRVTFVDLFATSCVVVRGAPAGPATILGTGAVVGFTLTSSFDQIRCTGGIVVSTSGGTHTFTYDSLSDTFSPNPDDWGGAAVTFSRVGA